MSQPDTTDPTDVVDDDAIDSVDDDTDDQTDTDDAPQPFVKPDGSPFTQADYDALQTSLRAARKEAREAKKAKGKDGTDNATTDVQAVEAAVTEAVTPWRTVVVNERASAALTAAGLIGSTAPLLRLLDTAAVDVELEDGQLVVDGLDEQVAGLKRTYPQLFRKPGAGSIDAAERRSTTDKRSATEIQAAALRGEL